jgi:hypothetical protein
MGVLSSFERRLSGLVEGTFAKVFKGWAEPVQIAGALQRELDERRVTSAKRTLVPNSFVIELSGRDHERLAPYSEALGSELASMVREHAEDQRYSFAGPVTIHLSRDTELNTGVFRIHSNVNSDGTIESPPEPTAHPDPPRDFYAREVEPPVEVLAVDAAPEPPAAVAVVETGASFYVTYAGGDLEARDRSFPLVAAVTRIGRAHDVDLRVDDSAVSRVHAEVRRLPEGRGHLLADLGSTNGTSVNGRRVQTWELREGDRVQIGSATLTYRPETR